MRVLQEPFDNQRLQPDDLDSRFLEMEPFQGVQGYGTGRGLHEGAERQPGLHPHHEDERHDTRTDTQDGPPAHRRLHRPELHLQPDVDGP